MFFLYHVFSSFRALKRRIFAFVFILVVCLLNTLLPVHATEITAEKNAILDHQNQTITFNGRVIVTHPIAILQCDQLVGHYKDKPHNIFLLVANDHIKIDANPTPPKGANTPTSPLYPSSIKISGDRLTINLLKKAALLTGKNIHIQTDHDDISGLDHLEMHSIDPKIIGYGLFTIKRPSLQDPDKMDVIKGSKVLIKFINNTKTGNNPDNTASDKALDLENHAIETVYIRDFHYQSLSMDQTNHPDDIDIIADHAVYDPTEHVFRLEGNVRMRQNDREITAPKAIYDSQKQHLSLINDEDGKVKIEIPGL